MATFKDVLLLVDKVSAPLKKITNGVKNATEKTNKMRTAVEKLNQKMLLMRPAFNKAWGGVTRITRAFAGLVGSSGLITMGIARITEFADNIDKMSQKIGMSTDEYQKWNYIMSINGGNVDSLAMGFKTLTTQIEGVQKGSKDSINAFKLLGVSVKDNNGNFRTQEAIFSDSIRKLQQISDVTKRDILANRLFGRSAAELRPLLNQSAEAVDKLAKNFEKYGMKLTKKEIENAVQFKDTWTTFTMFLQAHTNKALSQLLPKLQSMLEKIMQHKEAIQNVISTLGKLTLKVFEIVDFLTKHKGLLTGILSGIVALGAATLYTNIVAGIGAMTAAMATFGVTSNIALAGIPAIIGLISGAITALALNWGHNIEKMTNFINKLLDKLGALAYFMPFLGTMKIGRNLTRAVEEKISKNTVSQSQTNNTNNTTNNTTNFFGNIVASGKDTLDKLIHRSQTVPAT